MIFPVIHSIDWNPQNSGELAFIKQSGNFGKVNNFLEEDVSTSKVVEKTAVDENDMNADELHAALFDDADEDENSFSIRQIKKETGFLDDDDDTNLHLKKGRDGSSPLEKEMLPEAEPQLTPKPNCHCILWAL